jgi:16S rRNA (guanine966-N2)-methyltransferase
VTRIVAGAARGRRLAVPPAGTRPTSDRAREGLFSSLASLLELDGSRVLDLFAGTGAVGLEALSRGAAAVALVDSDPVALRTIKANVAAVALPGATVVRATLPAYLSVGGGYPFDLIFADPPYAIADTQLAETLELITADRWTRSGSIVVLERASSAPPTIWPDVIEPIKSRRYGAGMLWYGRRR